MPDRTLLVPRITLADPDKTATFQLGKKRTIQVDLSKTDPREASGLPKNASDAAVKRRIGFFKTLLANDAEANRLPKALKMGIEDRIYEISRARPPTKCGICGFGWEQAAKLELADMRQEDKEDFETECTVAIIGLVFLGPFVVLGAEGIYAIVTGHNPGADFDM